VAITTDSITRIKEGDLARRTSNRADFKNPQQGMLARPSVERVEPIDTLGEAFSAGISSGYDNIRAQNQNFLAALDTLKGDDVSARNRIREADFLENQAGIPLSGIESDFASALEEGNVHDFFLNTAAATGQFIPSLAASLAEAVVVGGAVVGGTALSGGTATPGLLTAAAVGTTARRKAVEGGVKALQRRKPGRDAGDVEDLLNRVYKNQIRVNAGKQPLHKFSKEELLDLDDIYGVMRSNLRGRRFTQGAVLGAFTQEQRMGTGIAFSDYVDQGMDSKQDAINSILQGSAFGLIGVGAEGLTAATALRAFKRPGRVKRTGAADPFKFDPIPPGSMFKDFASISAVTSASEGLAELLQEELSVQQKFRIDKDYTQAQARIDRVNALFAGVMGGLGVGGGLGAGTAVINKARNMSQRGVAEREMMRIFSDKEFQASIGAVMGERAAALSTQADFVANENSGADSFFVPIEAKAEFEKAQGSIEKTFEGQELFSVSTPIGVFFTTDQRKASRLANIMDSGYKYDTGILDQFLAGALGYSRSRDPRDDIVVGLFDNDKGEFVKYQSAREDVKGDAEAAQAAMNKIRAAMDPKRYTVEIQSLAQHRKFRQEGLPKDADVLKATKEAFETSDMSEMGTSDDDAGVEGDRGTQNLDVTAANIDIRKNKVTATQRAQFDAYLRDVYKLPINFSDLVFFIDQTRKLLLSGQQATQTTTEGQSNVASVEQLQSELDSAKQRLEELSSEETFEAYEQIENETERRAKVEEDAAFEKELKVRIKALESTINYLTKGEGKNLVFTEQQVQELLQAELETARLAEQYSPEALRSLSTTEKQTVSNEVRAARDRVIAARKAGVKPAATKTLDAVGKPGSNTRARYSQIYGELINAEKNAGPLNAEDRAFLQRMNSGGLERIAFELDGVLQEIVEEGAQLQQSDSIESSIARDEFGSREVTNVPLIGVSEVLNRTNVEFERPNPKDFKKGRKDKAYIKQLADFRAAQREAKAPIKEQDPVVMAKKGSGTVQNPFVDPKTDKGFEISKGDPKADGRSVAGLNTFIHPTLRAEFESQKPFLSKRAVQTFRDKAKIEREETSETGFLRFVDVRDLRGLRTATANNQPFVAPERPVATKTKPKVKPSKKNVPFKTFLRNNKLDPKAVGVAELRDRLDKGTFSYTKTGGMGVDQLIEAAVDAGYLREDNAGPQGQKTYTVDDIVELIDSNATPLADQEASFEAEYEARRLEAEGEQEVEQEVEEPTQDTNRRYVIVRMKPDPEQFREITRENVDTLRNIRADLQIRLDQAHARTRSGTYKTPIHFKLQNLNPEAKSRTPINVDMSVLLEGISTLSKIKQRRQPEEYMNQAAQRVASLLDAIDILQENNFKLEYYPLGVKEDAVFTMTGGKKKSDIELGAALDDIISQPNGPGASILRITIPKKFEGEFAQQVAYLRQQFGLPRLASGFFTNDRFAKVNVPLKDLVYEAAATPLTAGMNPAYIVPLIQNVEANTMQEMTLQELEDLADRAEDALSVRYAAVDKNSRKTPGEVKDLYGEVQAQDRTIMQFLNEIGKVIAAINSADIRNEPGKLQQISAPLGQPVTRDVAFGSPTGEVEIRQQQVNVPANRPNLAFRGAGGRIDRNVPIETYLDDLQAIAIERATPSIDETGMYNLDAPSDTQITDNSAIKMDIQDRNLFESYQEQQGKEFRGRDRYADLARAGNIKPTFKDNTKYQKVTAVYLGNVIQQKANKLKGIKNPPPRTRANLPFRKQIITNMIGAARNLGLTTNLHVIAAETGYSDSQLPPRIKNAIDQKNFDTKRQNLLNQPDKVAMTLQYRDFDIILMKTNPDITEGQYYSAFLKELGNSLTFQELEKSLKVPATRKKILQAYEQILKSDNVPPTYTDDDTGVENFMADQFGVAIRKELGIEVDGTVFDSMNKPTQAWFKRLAKSQKKMYDQSKIFKKRTEIDETFQEYAADLQQKLINPENQQVPYKVKASIESTIEGILGPETFTDKQLRKAMEQTSKLFKSKNLPTWLTKILLTSDTRLRNYGPVGEEIADFFNLDPRTVSKSGRAGIFTLKTRRANAMFNDVAKILGVEDGWIYSTLTSEQKQQIDLAADDTINTADLPPRARAVREYLKNDVYDNLGLNRYGVDERQNFFPRVVAVAEIAGNPKLQLEAFTELQIANPGVPQSEITNAVNSIVKKGSGELDFAASDEIDLGMMKERKELWSNITNKRLMDAGLALPAEVALKQYLDKVALKYEFEQSGGVERLNSLIAKLTPKQQQDSRNIIDSMFGKTPPIDKGWLKTANNVLLPVNIITLLAFTVLASLQDTAGPVLRSRGTAKISDIAGVIKNMTKNPQEAAELAREIGVIGVDAMSSFFIFAGEQNFMNQTAKNVSDTWFRVTLLEAYTKFTRVFATGMGTRFLQDSARKAQKGDTTAQLYLNELNVTVDEVLAWEKGKADDATRTKVNEALAQFVDESIVRPNPAQRPTYANNPRYALIWQLKSFFYAYGKTIVFPTLKESHRGFVNQGAGAGVMPLLLMAGILVPITMLGLEIRELTKYLLAELLPGIDGDDPGVNYFKTNSMSTGQYMIEIIDRSGMLGPASLTLPIFLESHRYGKPFWVPPLGPAAERVYDGVTWDWRVADYLPVYGQLDTRNLGR
tara:strand:- start:200 stop:8137 length:7938 start_codon:yes stop_codon:yes gene_type:complete